MNEQTWDSLRQRQAGFSKQPLPYLAIRPSLFRSFGFAWEGIAYTFKTQRNFQIHVAIAAITVALGACLSLSLVEWALVSTLIGLVLFAELANTAIEVLVDHLTLGQYDPTAKIVKDVAAGAVLISALAATLAGMVIFTPHVLKLVS